jgi:hypothetical protein
LDVIEKSILRLAWQSLSLWFKDRPAMKKIILRHLFRSADRAKIHAVIADFEQFGAFHPLMQQVALVERMSPYLARYDVQEEAKLFGWLKMKPRYQVVVETAAAHDGVVYTSKIMGIMQLRIDLTLLDERGQLWVLETVEVSRIPLLTKIFLDMFSDAHKETFARLRNELQSAI